MASRLKKSPSSRGREISLLSARRTDPPGLPLPTDPRMRPVWLRVYLRHWLFAALLQANFKYRRLLPPEMWGGHSPRACPPTLWVAHQRGKRRAA